MNHMNLACAPGDTVAATACKHAATVPSHRIWPENDALTCGDQIE